MGVPERLADPPKAEQAGVGIRRVIEPLCQCSSTRPVLSQNGYSSSGSSGGGSYGRSQIQARWSGFP